MFNADARRFQQLGQPKFSEPKFRSCGTGTVSEMSSDIVNFAAFHTVVGATEARGTATASTENGALLFEQVGCALCHSPALDNQAPSNYAALSEVTYHPYSDFALHHMGPGLGGWRLPNRSRSR
jgi:CxxC motif-containing protein (DUF1111 family)